MSQALGLRRRPGLRHRDLPKVLPASRAFAIASAVLDHAHECSETPLHDHESPCAVVALHLRTAAHSPALAQTLPEALSLGSA